MRDTCTVMPDSVNKILSFFSGWGGGDNEIISEINACIILSVFELKTNLAKLENSLSKFQTISPTVESFEDDNSLYGTF